MTWPSIWRSSGTLTNLRSRWTLLKTPVALISGLVLISPKVLTKASNSLMPMPARRSGRRYRTLVQISAMVFVIGVPVMKMIRPFRSWMAFVFR